MGCLPLELPSANEQEDGQITRFRRLQQLVLQVNPMTKFVI
jgi:hypothetical protein